ncbi:MAG: Crp/Fnr family transcriptional regulator [Nitrospirae bacterium]|nr:Crp/Fnr family transcriptional regulator [Nitrospirota bacterium]
MKEKPDTFLRKVSLFADLPDEDLKKIVRLTRIRQYRKQEVIFYADDPGTALFILKSGMVKISVMDKDLREVILKLLYPGDFFGEMALLDGQHRSATVTAMERSEAVVLDREAFLSILRQKPELILTMLLTVCRRLRQTDEKIRSLVFADAYGKVAETLLRLINEKGERGDDGVSIELPFSTKDLASLVGITRQTLSKVLKEYQRAGVIKMLRRQIHILDEARLQREALS